MKYELDSSDEFDLWLAKLDRTIKNRVLSRLARVENGNFGDHKALAPRLFELRCLFGGGLRMYYTLRENTIVLLLTGGDKSTQKADIARADVMLTKLDEDEPED
ncbi:MAG: type II toxin-antitoxin system RelE/ParE family toxin [Betaproteobacteria bacterium]|nr:type II toxin-antitoxin system RelE/ParE family toxin [Betaproteobacteria bacterium]